MGEVRQLRRPFAFKVLFCNDFSLAEKDLLLDPQLFHRRKKDVSVHNIKFLKQKLVNIYLV